MKPSIFGLALLSLVACAGNYGQLERSSEVSQIFEGHEVLADHLYFTSGSEFKPTAILGIRNDYTLKPGLWRPVEMDTKMLQRLIDAMTDQLGFTPSIMGAAITNPDGQRVGVWYSRDSHITIRFEDDNVIAVSLPSQSSDPSLNDTLKPKLPQ